jgi:hypothetical protein
MRIQMVLTDGMTQRAWAAVAAALCVLMLAPVWPAVGQTADMAAQSGQSAAQTVDTVSQAGEPAGDEPAGWEFSVALFGYIVPEGPNFFLPIATADREWLHLEGRYNYEDQETGSLWAGYNLGWGEEVTFEVTPMIGAVFGNTSGVAPGLLMTIAWWQLDLYTESEYLFDSEDSENDFFYTWAELGYSPLEWLRAGLVIQRTRAYETELEIGRGIFAGATVDRFDFGCYLLNLSWGDPTVALSATVYF